MTNQLNYSTWVLQYSLNMEWLVCVFILKLFQLFNFMAWPEYSQYSVGRSLLLDTYIFVFVSRIRHVCVCVCVDWPQHTPIWTFCPMCVAPNEAPKMNRTRHNPEKVFTLATHTRATSQRADIGALLILPDWGGWEKGEGEWKGGSLTATDCEWDWDWDWD